VNDLVETREVFQVRITPVLKGWGLKNVPVYYDARHIFLNTADADRYKPLFEAALKREGILGPKDEYKVTTIKLELVITESGLK